jgi:flavodoxin short chain
MESDMSNETVAVIYWSRTGNTEAMALALASGLADAGSEAEVLRIAGSGAHANQTPSSADTALSLVARCEKLAFGCPAMGKEVLEDAEFEPFFAAAQQLLADRKVALFGAYGWGNGEWMRNWQERVQASGARLFEEGFILQTDTSLKYRLKRLVGRRQEFNLEGCRTFGTRFAAF